jgi:hypothetical protein
MDWLALRLAKNFEGPDDREKGCKFWPDVNDEAQTSKPLRWTTFGDADYFTLAHSMPQHADDNSAKQITSVQRALKIRQRLDQLTGWTGKASEQSIIVASSIGTVLDALFKGNQEKPPFVWNLIVWDNAKIQNIELRVENIKGTWKVDATEIEAALSLCIYNVLQTEFEGIDIERERLWRRPKHYVYGKTSVGYDIKLRRPLV